jgi:hypothetical protein
MAHGTFPIWRRYWDQVDLQRKTAWIPGDKAKRKEDIRVSPSQLSVELLQG